MRRYLSLLFLISSVAIAADSKAPSPSKQNAPMKNLSAIHVYIIHGYMASPRDHWFPWLKDKLTAHGAQVSVLALPNSAKPNATEWDHFLNENITAHNDKVFFVAHSLGCISLLRHLTNLDEGKRIGGFILVSGFSSPITTMPQLDQFVEAAYDAEKIMRIAPKRSMIASRNDSIVPYTYSHTLSEELKAGLITVENGGHFLASEDFTELPIVYDELQAMFPR